MVKGKVLERATVVEFDLRHRIMSDVGTPYADSPRSTFKQQSASYFQRVQLVHWKQINGFSVVAMEQFQLNETFEATVAEIRELQPKLFKKSTTKCPIYREADPKV